MRTDNQPGALGTLTPPLPPLVEERGSSASSPWTTAVILAPAPDEPRTFSCCELLRDYRVRTSSGHFRAASYRYRLPSEPSRVVRTEGPFEDNVPHDTSGITPRQTQLATVYNPSIDVDGIMAVRWERLDTEQSIVELCSYKDGAWTPGAGPTIRNAQDPFLTRITHRGTSYGILSVNQITELDDDGIGVKNWTQHFYRFEKSVTEVCEPFAAGLPKQKCGRVAVWPDGKIAVFGRRQGDGFGTGRITYTEISFIEELEEGLQTAPTIEGAFPDGQWGGVNYLIPLSNRYMLIIGHIACFNTRKSYWCTEEIFDRTQRRIIEKRIILDALDLPFTVVAKKEDLNRSVVYIGGAEMISESCLRVSGGCGDTGAFEAVCQSELAPRFLGVA